MQIRSKVQVLPGVPARLGYQYVVDPARFCNRIRRVNRTNAWLFLKLANALTTVGILLGG